MILFSQLLKKEKPQHKLETTMLISSFVCGCQTTITYANEMNCSLGATNDNLLSDSSQCKKDHAIDFKEIDKSKNISIKNLITEILGFNSIAISSRIKKGI